jgi:ParB family transcriptional regulator, chromosome partitioning protein
MKPAKIALIQIPISQIERGRYQPRKEFDQEALQELAQSIQSTGLLQPIVVRPTAEDNNYEIIAGERRWRASQLAGLTEISCLVKHFSDEQAAEAAAIENIIRVDLNAIEVANAYQRLIDDFGYIHDEIAVAMGKSRVKVTNALRLLRLDKSIQELIIEGRLSEGHGKVLASLPPTQQRELSSMCLTRGWSVRKIEQEVKKLSLAKEENKHAKDPNLQYLEKAVADKVGCKTKIEFDDNKGQLKIDFNDLDVLEGILKKLNVSVNDFDKD